MEGDVRRKTDRQVPLTVNPFRTIRLVLLPVGSSEVERLFPPTVCSPEKNRLVILTILLSKGDALISPQVQKVGSPRVTSMIRASEGTQFRPSMIQI